jgi:ATP-dependent DNA helicase DinG
MGKKPPIRVALDLETTGLHVEQDAILEVAAVKFQGTTILDTLETLVAPGRAIPYRVQRLTGITPRQLIGVPSFDAVARKLQQFLGGFPIVGHSIPFDVSFLRRRGLAYGNQLIDTFELAAVLLPSLPSYSLGHVARFLGVPVSSERHRAMADTLLAMQVFLALCERLQAMDLAALEELANLDAPPDWPLLTFFRQEWRERQRQDGLARGSLWGNLGNHFAAQLAMDPRVLSFAVARAGPAQPAPPPAETAQLPEAALPVLEQLLAQLQILAEAGEPERQRFAAGESGSAAGYAGLRLAVRTALERRHPLLIETALGGADYLPVLLAVLEWLAEASTAAAPPALSPPRLLISCASTQFAYRLKDALLPHLQRRAGSRLSVAYLAERDGYLCLHRWFGPAQFRLGGAPGSEEARAFAKLALWAQQTLTGERGELTLLPQELATWERICSGGERLPAGDGRAGDIYERCAYRRRGYCFYERAEERVRGAQIVVTTHAGLLDDLSSPHPLLSEIPYRLILDADLLEDECLRRSSLELSHSRLLSLLETLGSELRNGRYQGLLALAAPALRGSGVPGPTTSATVTRADLDSRLLSWFQTLRQARSAVEQFFAALARLMEEALHSPGNGGKHERNRAEGNPRNQTARAAERSDQALRLQRSLQGLEAWSDVEHAWREVSERLQAVIDLAQEAERLLLTAGRNGHRFERSGMPGDSLAAEFALNAHRLRELKGRGDQAFALKDSDMVYWLRLPSLPGQSFARTADPPGATAEHAREQTPVLHGQPIQIPGVVKHGLLGSENAGILAGTALAVAGDFSFYRGRLALERESAPALSLELDRRAQTLLYLPDDVPEPNMPQYQRRLEEAILRLAESLEGQTVVLFTSHAALRSSYTFMKATLEARDILLLGHGIDGSARQLWQIFCEQPRVLLFATGSFWEGLEELNTVPACIFISRLPMPALNDPPLAARAERYSDQLRQMTVPLAALRLRRALNRLAWSCARRNSVVLFDRRVIAKDYGPLILRSLPPCSQRQGSASQMPETILDWLTSEGVWSH